MAKVFAFANFKGGVGKTTSVVNVGAALARSGKRVLLVDMDAQHNLTTSVGVTNPARTIYPALRGDYPLPVVNVGASLDLVPADIELVKADYEFAVILYEREKLLAKALKPILGQYDAVLIDCPPSLAIVALNAFLAADFIFVPIEAEFLALKGYRVLADALERIGLGVDGVFVTKYDSRKSLNRQALEAIRTSAGAAAFETAIRANVALAESPTAGKSVFDYAPKSSGAADYAALTAEIEKRFF